MEEMLRTWRQGGVGGVELFGPDVREGIEAGIFGTSKGGFHPAPSGGVGGYIDPVVIAKQKVGQSLAEALKVKRAALARNPGDAEARVHVGVLEQVRSISSLGSGLLVTMRFLMRMGVLVICRSRDCCPWAMSNLQRLEKSKLNWIRSVRVILGLCLTSAGLRQTSTLNLNLVISSTRMLGRSSRPTHISLLLPIAFLLPEGTARRRTSSLVISGTYPRRSSRRAFRLPRWISATC